MSTAWKESYERFYCKQVFFRKPKHFAEYIDTKRNKDYVSIRDGPFDYSTEIARCVTFLSLRLIFRKISPLAAEIMTYSVLFAHSFCCWIDLLKFSIAESPARPVRTRFDTSQRATISLFNSWVILPREAPDGPPPLMEWNKPCSCNLINMFIWPLFRTNTL